MYAPTTRPVASAFAALMVATTLLTVTLAPEPAKASTAQAAETVRFPLA